MALGFFFGHPHSYVLLSGFACALPSTSFAYIRSQQSFFPFGFGIVLPILVFALKSVISRACPGAHSQDRPPEKPHPVTFLRKHQVGDTLVVKDRKKTSPRATLSRVTQVDKRFDNFLDLKQKSWLRIIKSLFVCFYFMSYWLTQDWLKTEKPVIREDLTRFNNPKGIRVGKNSENLRVNWVP